MVVALVGAAAVPGVLALRVLAHDHPVELALGAVGQGRGRAGKDAGAADVGVLLEGLADGQAEAPEADVVGDVGRSDRAEAARRGRVAKGEAKERRDLSAYDLTVAGSEWPLVQLTGLHRKP